MTAEGGTASITRFKERGGGSAQACDEAKKKKKKTHIVEKEKLGDDNRDSTPQRRKPARKYTGETRLKKTKSGV